MNRITRFLLSLAAAFISRNDPACLAQQSDFGSWFTYNLQLKITPAVGLGTDLNYRDYAFFTDTEQELARFTGSYNFAEDKFQAAIGCAYAHSENYRKGSSSKKTTTERRLFQQMLQRTKTGRMYINHRFRMEQRFFDDHSNLRFRYQVQLLTALNKEEILPGTFYLLLSDEIFINGISPVFDRNRLLGSIGYMINPAFKIESGVLFQMLENRHRAQVLFTVYQTLNFKKN